MRGKIIFAKISSLALLILSGSLLAQSDLGINGYIQTYNRVRFDDGSLTLPTNIIFSAKCVCAASVSLT